MKLADGQFLHLAAALPRDSYRHSSNRANISDWHARVSTQGDTALSMPLLLTLHRNLPRRKQRNRCFFDKALNQSKANRRSGPKDPDMPRKDAIGGGQFPK